CFRSNSRGRAVAVVQETRGGGWPTRSTSERASRVYKGCMALSTVQALVSSVMAALCLVSPAAGQGSGKPVTYAKLCASCHAEAATGTDAGPGQVETPPPGSRSEKLIQDLIRTGSPGRMPPFALPEDQVQALARWVRSLNISVFDSAPAGD